MAKKKTCGMEHSWLRNEEWAGFSQCVLGIHTAASPDDVRYKTLCSLVKLAPFETAAFFLAKPDYSSLDGCLMAQPSGTEISMQEFEVCVEAVMDVQSKLGEDPRQAFVIALSHDDEVLHSRMRKTGCHLVNSDILACVFACERGLLGALVLARKAGQSDFSDRDLFVIDMIEPHLTARLQRIYDEGSYQVLNTASLKENYGLTNRECEVMSCIAYGMTSSEIAVKLNISKGTTRKHLENIYRKAGVNNRMSLMRLAQQCMDASERPYPGSDL